MKTLQAVVLGVCVFAVVVVSGVIKYHLDREYIRHHVVRVNGYLRLNPGDKIEWYDMEGQRNTLTMIDDRRGSQETWLHERNLPKPLTNEEFEKAKEELKRRLRGK